MRDREAFAGEEPQNEDLFAGEIAWEEGEFGGEIPAVTQTELRVGDMAIDEGVYTCRACDMPGAEVSVLPGQALPVCPRCGDDARWEKV